MLSILLTKIKIPFISICCKTQIMKRIIFNYHANLWFTCLYGWFRFLIIWWSYICVEYICLSQWWDAAKPRGLVHEGFMSSLFKSCRNPYYCYIKNNDQIRSPFCTCHSSSAAVACAKSWPDWIIRIQVTTKRIFTRFQLWAHKLCVKRVPGPLTNQ